MIRSFWPKCMATVGLERREKTYKELIVQLEKLELFIPEDDIKRKILELHFMRRILKYPERRRSLIRRGTEMIRRPDLHEMNPVSYAR